MIRVTISENVLKSKIFVAWYTHPEKKVIVVFKWEPFAKARVPSTEKLDGEVPRGRWGHYADLPWVGGLTAGVIAQGQGGHIQVGQLQVQLPPRGLWEASPTSQWPTEIALRYQGLLLLWEPSGWHWAIVYPHHASAGAGASQTVPEHWLLLHHPHSPSLSQ